MSSSTYKCYGNYYFPLKILKLERNHIATTKSSTKLRSFHLDYVFAATISINPFMTDKKKSKVKKKILHITVDAFSRS